MIIIGERINSTRPEIQAAIKNRNVSFILKEVTAQLKAGVDYIDINCAQTSGDEMQDIDWVISVIQSEIEDVSICIDSPNYLAIDRALNTYKAKGSLIINSISAEEARIEKILPLIIKHKAKVIALAMDEKGMPKTASERLGVARKILDRVKRNGFNPEDLYIDPLVRPISTEPQQAKEVLDSIPLIKSAGLKTVIGLSNVSFGLPNRSLINRTFLSMAIEMGLDAAICDPLDKGIISSITASNALLGLDEYCVDYIKAFRAGKL